MQSNTSTLAVLQENWKSLLAPYVADASGRLWKELEQQYCQKGRHYHTLQHLQYMLELALQHKERIQDYDCLLFSIFYHDVIYRASRKDNEEKSAAYGRIRMEQLGLPEEMIRRSVQQIEATKQHQFSDDTDTNYLLDFDLAILGDTWPVYAAYTRKIRKEYALYPDFLYNPGRKKVLQHFLAMEKIFKTAPFISSREEQARNNLQRELAML